MSSAVTLAVRFAQLVAHQVASPGSTPAHRDALRAFVRAMKGHDMTLAASARGELLANGELCTDAVGDAACTLLASRLATYGVETITLREGSAEGDLSDLVRLLATEPPADDPAAFFAVRATVIDARGVPRTLRPRDGVSPAPVAMASPPPAAAAEVPFAEEIRVTEQFPVPPPELPVPTDAALAALFARLQEKMEPEDQRPLLDALADFADSAYRSGKHGVMLEAIVGLMAIEHAALERDPTDARRAAFARPFRRVANPLILRQLTIMRHRMAGNAVIVHRLHSVLSRLGPEGAEALLEEYVNVPTGEARAEMLEALRALRRTAEVLRKWVRDPDPFVVRDAVMVLRELGGESAARLLAETIRHPQVRVRVATVAALAASTAASVIDLLGLAVADISPAVRASAVAALSARGPAALPRLLPLLDAEADSEVLYAAMHAIGTIGAPEGIQRLIACAQGESAHMLGRNSTFRLQACGALVVARTPQAMAAVGLLRDDRDRVVREGAIRLVAQAKRRTTGSIRVVTE